jgi:hypothetical protein
LTTSAAVEAVVERVGTESSADGLSGLATAVRLRVADSGTANGSPACRWTGVGAGTTMTQTHAGADARLSHATVKARSTVAGATRRSGGRRLMTAGGLVGAIVASSDQEDQTSTNHAVHESHGSESTAAVRQAARGTSV